MKTPSLINNTGHLFKSVGFIHNKSKAALTPWLSVIIIVTQLLYLMRYVFLALSPTVNSIIVKIAAEFTVGGNIAYYEIAFVIIFIVLNALYNFLSGSILAVLSKKVCSKLYAGAYSDFLNKTSSVKYEYYNNPEIYENISLVKNDIYSLVSSVYVSGMFASIIGLVIVIVYTFVALVKVNVLVGFILLLANSTTIISSYIQTKKDFYAEVDQIKEKRWGDRYAELLTSPETEKEVRLYASFDYIYQKWLDVQNTRKKKSLALLKQYTLVDIIIAAVKYILLFVSLAIVLYYILRGERSIEALMLIYSSHAVLDGKLSEFFGSIMNLKSISYRVDMWRKIDALENENSDAGSKRLEDGLKISIDHLSYSYEGTDTNAVDDVSVEISSSEKIAIVGENGSGKTTLVHLILGLLTPKEGTVRINGIDLSEIKDEFRDRILVLFQDFCTYQLSLKDNILIGDQTSGKNDNDIKRISEMSKLSQLTDSYDSGLDTMLGAIWPSGVDLSGGQRQRLGLARLYAREDAELLIMDEPTAALDPEAETDLYNNIINDFADKGMIMVSHRLGFMNHLDKIIVMKKGKIVDVGSHAELLSRCDYYREMYTSFEQYYNKDKEKAYRIIDTGVLNGRVPQAELITDAAR